MTRRDTYRAVIVPRGIRVCTFCRYARGAGPVVFRGKPKVGHAHCRTSRSEMAPAISPKLDRVCLEVIPESDRFGLISTRLALKLRTNLVPNWTQSVPIEPSWSQIAPAIGPRLNPLIPNCTPAVGPKLDLVGLNSTQLVAN